MKREDTNQTVKDSTTVWCGGCGAWFRTSVYRMINGDVDFEIVDRFLEHGFAGINHSSCAACSWEYVAEERLGVHYPSRGVLLLVVPDGLRHRAQRLRANFIEDVTQAPGQMVAPYLLEPTLVGGKDELAKMLEVRGVVHEEGELSSMDESLGSMNEPSISLSGDDHPPPESTPPQEAVRRRAKSLNLLAELLSDEEDTEDSVAPGLHDGPPLAGLSTNSDKSLSGERFTGDVTVDPFLDDEDGEFSVPISSNVGNRLRVLLDDEIVAEEVDASSAGQFVDTSESSIGEDAMAHMSAGPLETAGPPAGGHESVDESQDSLDVSGSSLDSVDQEPVSSVASVGQAESPSSEAPIEVVESGRVEALEAEDAVREIHVDEGSTASESDVESSALDADVEPQSIEDLTVVSEPPTEAKPAAPSDSPTEQAPQGFEDLALGAGLADLTHSEPDEGDVGDSVEGASREPAESELEGLHEMDPDDLEQAALSHGLVLRDGLVYASSIQAPEVLESARVGDLAIRFQHHRLDEGSALALSLVISGSNEFEVRHVVWSLDPKDPKHAEILGRLAESFEVEVHLGADGDDEVLEWTLAHPLAPNVSEVLALDLDVFSSDAAEKVSEPGYPVLGEMHHNFTEDSFSQLLTAAEARLAVGIVSYWNSPSQRDYLIGVQSFPSEWWAQIVRRVLEAAYQFGLVVEGSLRGEMRRFARADDESDLLRVLIAHFAEVNLNLRPSELDPLDLWENWDQLLVWSNSVGLQVDAQVEELASRALADAERFASDDESQDESYAAIEVSLADAIDVASFGPAHLRAAGLPTADSGSTIVIEPAMAELSDGQLLEALSDSERRAGAAVHLVGRGLTEHAVRVFDAVKEMAAPELGVVVPSLLPVSEAFVSLFRSVLYTEDDALRLSAAMLLAEVGDERALSPVLAMMLEPEEERWEVLAESAARLGPMVVQPGLSRAAVDETSAYRIAVLLGYVASTNGGILDGLEEQQDDPAVVACIGRARSVAEALGRPETPPFAHRLTTVLESLAHTSIHG